jgi:hypothetical protein
MPWRFFLRSLSSSLSCNLLDFYEQPHFSSSASLRILPGDSMLPGNSTAWNPGSSSTSPLHFRSDSVPSGGSAGYRPYRGLLPGLSILPANTWRSRRSFTLMTRAIFVASTEGQSPPLPHGPLALSQFLSSGYHRGSQPTSFSWACSSSRSISSHLLDVGCSF